MYRKLLLILVLIGGFVYKTMGFSPPLSNDPIILDSHEKGIRTKQLSAPMIQALDFYFNQSFYSQKEDNHTTETNHPTSARFDATLFDDYVDGYAEEDQGKDNLNQKITQTTLADYRRLTDGAKSLINKARDINTIVSGLSGNDLVELPIALRFIPNPNKPDFRITLVISELKLYPQFTQMATYLMVEAAELGGEPLIFYSPNVKFSMKSGIVGDNVLGLMGDFPLPVFSEKALLKLRGSNVNTLDNSGRGTYAVIGCDGLKNLSLGASLIFSRDWIKPADRILDPEARVTADLQVSELKDLSSLYTDLSIEPFVLSGLEDFVWQVSQISVDMSDQISPPDIINRSEMVYYGLPDQDGKPIEYRHKFSNPGKLWKGFYIGEISVTIPDQFNPNRENLTIGARHLIFDDLGISGQASVSKKPLLEFGKTNLDGWAFGIDEMTLTMVQSQYASANFSGDIHVPLLDKGNKTTNEGGSIRYEASLDPENGYSFIVGLNQTNTIPLLVAEADIHPSSKIFFTYDQQIRLRALLNGEVNISKELSSSLSLDLPRVGIRNVDVRNYGQKLQLNTDQWEVDLSEPMDFGLFTLELQPTSEKKVGDSYSVINAQPNADIEFFAKVTLSAEENLSGAGSFSIQGKLEEEAGLERWVHKNLVLNSFCVNGGKIIPGIDSIQGCLEFYTADHSNGWGDGFRGFMNVAPSRILDNLKMIAQFGQTASAEEGGFQYYMIDASAQLEKGIPLGGSIYLNGLGGGFYKNLIRPEAIMAYDQIRLPDFSEIFIQNYGASMSGVMYRLAEPGKSTFGFKTTAVLSTESSIAEGKNVAFSGNLELGMEYAETENGSSKYGVQQIYFQGVGAFMEGFDPGRVITKYADFMPGAEAATLLDRQLNMSLEQQISRPTNPPIPGSMVSAKVLLQASFNCPSFYGILGVYLNAGMVYGQAEAEMYIGNNCTALIDDAGSDWHLFIGKSTDPARLGIDLPIIGDLTKLWAYFMIGNHGMPADVPAPSDYLALFGEDGYNPSISSEASLYQGVDYQNEKISRGQGFATGMGMRLTTPPDGLKFLFLSAHLQGGLGLDVLVKKFVQSECTQTVGINGWYGKGQGYMYVYAGIDLHLNLWFATIKKEILSAAVGALLKVEGPNPFFARGRLDAHLNLLGLKDINVKFKVKIGTTMAEYVSQECAREFNTAENPIVDEIYPSAQESDDGTYPGYTDFIIEMNFEPLTSSFDGDLEFVIDLIDQKKYDQVIDQLKNQDDKNPLIAAGFITLLDANQKEVPFSLEYLNRSYPDDRNSTFKVAIKPERPLPPGECTLKVPALVKAKNIPDFGPFEKWKVGEWFYGEGQVGDPYRFMINDSIYAPQLSEEDIAFTYPAANMTHFHTHELTRADLSDGNIGDFGFEPGYLIGLNKDFSFLLEDSKITPGYTAYGLIIDPKTNSQIGQPLKAGISSNRRDEPILYFERHPNLELSTEYLFQFVYLKNENAPMLEPFGEKWVIAEIPFTTSLNKTFANKIDQFKLLIENTNITRNEDLDKVKPVSNIMNWAYETQEAFAPNELSENEGVYVDVVFDNKNRKSEYWLADNDLYWNLFEDYNDCEKEIFSNSIHPSEDIRLKSNSESRIELASTLHSTISQIYNQAKTYVSQHSLCSPQTEQNDQEGQQPSLENDPDEDASFCGNFYAEGIGLRSQNGIHFRPDFTDEVCDQFYRDFNASGTYQYGIKFKYQVAINLRGQKIWIPTSEKILSLEYTMP